MIRATIDHETRVVSRPYLGLGTDVDILDSYPVSLKLVITFILYIAEVHVYTMLPLREALSGIFGSIALASWTTVFIPQLVENYRQQSAEAVSLIFLAVWILGDVLSLMGSVWAGLLPVIIANGVAFCITDFIFLNQCIYYRLKTRRKLSAKMLEVEGLPEDQLDPVRTACECTPFLRQVPKVGAGALESAQPIHQCRHQLAGDPKRDYVHDEFFPVAETRSLVQKIRNHEVALFVVTVVMVGSMGWLFAYRIGLWHPSTQIHHGKVVEKDILAQILGYCSAIANLCVRPPQILKNMREKSCIGLSASFITLSFVGNTALGASILSHSFDRGYILTNLPWLIADFIPAMQDLILLAQIRMFR